MALRRRASGLIGLLEAATGATYSKIFYQNVTPRRKLINTEGLSMATIWHIPPTKALGSITPHILLNLLQTTIASKSKVFKNALFVNQLKKIDGFKFYVCCRNHPNWFLFVHFFHTEFYKRRSFLGFIYNRIGYTSAIPLKIGFICPRNDLQCNLQSDL